MRPIFQTIFKSPAALALVLIVILASLSLRARSDDFAQATGARNLEATHHALLTIRALRSSPVESHWLLPTVSLGAAADKHIPWGATVPTDTGDFIYTSFTPVGFLAPYLALGVAGGQASVEGLAYFSFLCGAATTLVLFALLYRVLRHGGHGRWLSASAALLGVLVSIFSREALQSHGIVYWVHSFYQPVLALTLYALFRYLAASTGPDDPGRSGRSAVPLVLLVFLGAWTEWTGYVFGLGLAAMCWFGVLLERPHRRLSIQLLLALAAAGLLTLAHYAAALGLEPAMDAFIGRFLARGASRGTLSALLDGYGLSFGVFILAAGVALAGLMAAVAAGRQPWRGPPQRNTAFLLLAASIPLLENLIMLQHAGEFSFDRLKFIFPAALLISCAVAALPVAGRAVLALAMVAASIQGCASYRADLARHSGWAAVDARNQALADAIRKEVDLNCSVLLSPGVRGYANNLFGRGIHETARREDSLLLLRRQDACAAIYLDGEWAFQDLPRYRSATITRPDGSVTEIGLPLAAGH
jgi:hypothetical protein